MLQLGSDCLAEANSDLISTQGPLSALFWVPITTCTILPLDNLHWVTIYLLDCTEVRNYICFVTLLGFAMCLLVSTYLLNNGKTESKEIGGKGKKTRRLEGGGFNIFLVHLELIQNWVNLSLYTDSFIGHSCSLKWKKNQYILHWWYDIRNIWQF